MKATLVLAFITVGFCITPIASAGEPGESGLFTFSVTAPGGAIRDDFVSVFGLTLTPDPGMPDIDAITHIELEITGLNHTYPDDLDIFLIDPFATDLIRVMNDQGGGSENPLVGVNLTFSDSAQDPLPDEDQIFSGTFRPEGLENEKDFGLGTFIGNSGGSPQQQWLLVVIDDSPMDFGSFDSFTLRGTYVPEPATLSLLAFGALAILHRRRR